MKNVTHPLLLATKNTLGPAIKNFNLSRLKPTSEVGKLRVDPIIPLTLPIDRPRHISEVYP